MLPAGLGADTISGNLFNTKCINKTTTCVSEGKARRVRVRERESEVRRDMQLVYIKIKIKKHKNRCKKKIQHNIKVESIL